MIYTYIIHMTTFVAKIKYIMYNVQDYSILCNNPDHSVIWDGILLTCGKHLHDPEN